MHELCDGRVVQRAAHLGEFGFGGGNICLRLLNLHGQICLGLQSLGVVLAQHAHLLGQLFQLIRDVGGLGSLLVDGVSRDLP